MDRLGEEPFDLTISIEVVDHLYAAGSSVWSCRAALVPGDRIIVSSTLHGRLKDVALDLSGKVDQPSARASRRRPLLLWRYPDGRGVLDGAIT